MKVVAGVLAAVGVFVLVACENDTYESDPGSYGPSESCDQFTSCEACTPVSGCGWCFDSNGNGQCASDPDGCSTQSFSWTWNPSGCRVETDAGSVVVSSDDAGSVTPVDAGSTSATDAAICVPPAMALTATLADGASGSCTAQPSGNLCTASDFQVSCLDGASPNPMLSCSIVPIPTPSDELFYCCPCAGSADAVSTK